MVCDHFLVPAGSVSKITVSSLTVGTSVGLQPQSHPPVGVPVGRDEPQEASDDRLLQFVLNHAVCIAVAGKGLDNTRFEGRTILCHFKIKAERNCPI